jgi:hypothetical protein
MDAATLAGSPSCEPMSAAPAGPQSNPKLIPRTSIAGLYVFINGSKSQRSAMMSYFPVGED